MSKNKPLNNYMRDFTKSMFRVDDTVDARFYLNGEETRYRSSCITELHPDRVRLYDNNTAHMVTVRRSDYIAFMPRNTEFQRELGYAS